MTRKAKRAREHKRREQRILGVALDLSNRLGCEQMTIDQIARAADVGKGTVYTHFRSKDVLLSNLAIAFNNDLLADIREIAMHLPIATRLQGLLSTILHRHINRPEYHAVLQYCSRARFRRVVGPDTSAVLDEVEADIGQAIKSVLDDGIRLGIFRTGPAETLFDQVQSTLFGSIPMIWNGAIVQVDPHRYVEELTSLQVALLSRRDDTDTQDDAGKAESHSSSSAEIAERLVCATQLDELYAARDHAEFERVKVMFGEKVSEAIQDSISGLPEDVQDAVRSLASEQIRSFAEEIYSFNSGKTYSELLASRVDIEVLKKMLAYYVSSAGRADITITREIFKEVSELAESHAETVVGSRLKNLSLQIRETLGCHLRKRTSQGD
jgi:AcrR family transcriptional regulator